MANLQLTGISYRAYMPNSPEGNTSVSVGCANATASVGPTIVTINGVLNYTAYVPEVNAVASTMDPTDLSIIVDSNFANATASGNVHRTDPRSVTALETYGYNLYSGKGISEYNSDIYRVNIQTLEQASIGTSGESLIGIAQDPTTGIVYATSYDVSASPKHLLTIDMDTGIATPISTFTGAQSISDISFDSTGQLYGYSETFDAIAIIDKSDASITSLVYPGYVEYSPIGNALAFNSSDELWVCPSGSGYAVRDGETFIYKIDQNDGSVLEQLNIFGIQYGYQNKAIESAAFDQNDNFWVIIRSVGSDFILANINLSTGKITTVGMLPYDTAAIEWIYAKAPNFASINPPKPTVIITSPIAVSTAATLDPTDIIIDAEPEAPAASAIASFIPIGAFNGNPKAPPAEAIADIGETNRLKDVEITSPFTEAVAGIVSPVRTNPPDNDLFVNAELISGAFGSVNGNNTGATLEEWELYLYPYYYYGPNTIHYKWVAPEAGYLSLITRYYQLPEIEDSVVIFTSEEYLTDGDPYFPDGVPFDYIDYNDDGNIDYYSLLEYIPVRKDITYYITVTGYGSAGQNQGWFTLEWALT